MQCNYCQYKNPKESNFCQKCGKRIEIQVKKSKEKETKASPSNKEKSTTLWDKFVELYDSKDQKRQVYTDQMSNGAWELIDRISLNTFESFIADNKEQLNKLPYKVIEQFKNVFNWCVSGGYWMWYAETYYNGSKIKILQEMDVENLRETWNNYAIKKYIDTYNGLSEEVKNLMNSYLQIRLNNLTEIDSIKELTKEVVDKITTALIYNIIMGYAIALAENDFRK